MLKTKIFKVGNSRAVVLPKKWLDFFEETYGVADEVLIILEKRQVIVRPLNQKKE